MKTFLIYNNKGGSGKSPSTIALAGIFADIYNKRVLIVDGDSQINLSSILLKNNPQYLADMENGEQKTIVTAFQNKTIKGQTYKSELPRKNQKTGRRLGSHYTIDILAGDKYLDAVEDIPVELLKDLLKEVESEYDYVFIDCHPSKEGITLSAFVASDYILVPTAPKQTHLDGLSSASTLLTQLKKANYCQKTEILGAFFTMYRSNISYQNQIEQHFRDSFPDLFFDVSTRESTLLDEAAYMGVPLHSYKPTSVVAKEYKELAEEILNRIKKGDK
ncbi:chromosome partitioning protein [Lachnospiraceae bacterium PF1-22]